MYHPLGTPLPISGLVVDASLKILPLQNNTGTWEMFERGTTVSIAKGTVTVGANGRAVGTKGQMYNPDLAKTFPYTATDGVTYSVKPVVGQWYDIVIAGKAVAGLADIACPAGAVRLMPAEDTPGVPKVAVTNLPAFPSNFAKLLISVDGKVTPGEVTVCGYAPGMAPVSIKAVTATTIRDANGTPIVDIHIGDGNSTVSVNVPVQNTTPA